MAFFFTMGRTIILWGRGSGQFLKKEIPAQQKLPKKSCEESHGRKNEQLLLSTIINLSFVVKNVLHKLYPIKKSMHGLKV